ncbi:MAG: transposase family protein [Anaerolineales bacterium]
MSLLSLLKTIPDPRSRRRREYPLHGMLAILILAAAHGENSLRGMWQWAREREEKLLNFWPLDLWANDRLPSLGTFWYLLTRLSADALRGVLRAWGGNEAERALDGKALRGSKRAEEPALRVVTMMGQTLYQVLAQQPVEEGDELAAALRLLEAEDLAGKVVSADAGLLKIPLVHKVVEKGGPISAQSKTITPG